MKNWRASRKNLWPPICTVWFTIFPSKFDCMAAFWSSLDRVCLKHATYWVVFYFHLPFTWRCWEEQWSCQAQLLLEQSAWSWWGGSSNWEEVGTLGEFRLQEREKTLLQTWPSLLDRRDWGTEGREASQMPHHTCHLNLWPPPNRLFSKPLSHLLLTSVQTSPH